MKLPLLHVYSRPGCHLCEQLIEELLPLVRERAGIEVLNIDSRADWTEKYGTRIPVLELDGQALCQYSLDVRAVVAALDALEMKQ
jgi:hypothetical protein